MKVALQNIVFRPWPLPAGAQQNSIPLKVGGNLDSVSEPLSLSDVRFIV